jgi:hypothetical protein
LVVVPPSAYAMPPATTIAAVVGIVEPVYR